jgi:hypothetical protein
MNITNNISISDCKKSEGDDGLTTSPVAMSQPLFKMDRTVLSVADLHDDSDEKSFWLSKTPAERLAAMELMRQIVYGYEYETAPRLQRVFTIAERP